MQRQRPLTGTYECSLDERSRLAIPARVRERYADGAVAAWWIDDHSVILVPRLDWESLVENTIGPTDPLDANARELRRYLNAGAYFQDVLDRQGRVLIPTQLRSHGELTNRVVVVGVGEYLEVWDPARLDQRFATFDNGGVADLALRVRDARA